MDPFLLNEEKYKYCYINNFPLFLSAFYNSSSYHDVGILLLLIMPDACPSKLTSQQSYTVNLFIYLFVCFFFLFVEARISVRCRLNNRIGHNIRFSFGPLAHRFS